MRINYKMIKPNVGFLIVTELLEKMEYVDIVHLILSHLPTRKTVSHPSVVKGILC